MNPKIKKHSFVADRLSFGEFGLLSLENGLMDSKEIDAARRFIVGAMKRKGRLWIRIFPDRPVTKKPEEVKMGSGKGDIFTYVAVIKKGKILFELGGISEKEAREALRGAAHKLSLRVKFIGLSNNV